MRNDVANSGLKDSVREFWQEAACGEKLYLNSTSKAAYKYQAEERYRLEPYIPEFARFDDWSGKRVLEIGVGLGADHQSFLENGGIVSGIDLTLRAVELTEVRLELFGLKSDLCVGDAENLDFDSGQFDLVYSWGVIHHSPNTESAIREIYRVLKPGGTARVMIYNKWSMVGLMLWLRYGFLRFRPFIPLRDIYARYLESPGTKAYTVASAKSMFAEFENIQIRIELTHGDLLSSNAGQRHKGKLLTLARKIWPRRFIRRYMSNWGLFMLIDASKPSE